MNGFTLGGRPLNEARIWDDTANQDFGKILLKLFSFNFQVQYEGLQEYYLFRRDFIKEVFEEKIDALDKFRLERKGKPVREILEGIWQNASKGNKEPFITEGVSMQTRSLEQICQGLKLVGEGLIGLSENLYKGVNAVPITPVQTLKEEKKEERKPEGAGAIAKVDFTALRKIVGDKMLELVNGGKKPDVIKTLAEFDAKKLPEVKDESLQKLLDAFNKIA